MHRETPERQEKWHVKPKVCTISDRRCQDLGITAPPQQWFSTSLAFWPGWTPWTNHRNSKYVYIKDYVENLQSFSHKKLNLKKKIISTNLRTKVKMKEKTDQRHAALDPGCATIRPWTRTSLRPGLGPNPDESQCSVRKHFRVFTAEIIFFECVLLCQCLCVCAEALVLVFMI